MGRNQRPLVMGYIMTQALLIAEADARVELALSERPWIMRTGIGHRLDIYSPTRVPKCAKTMRNKAIVREVLHVLRNATGSN